jgi:hypothetical protein
MTTALRLLPQGLRARATAVAARPLAQEAVAVLLIAAALLLFGKDIMEAPLRAVFVAAVPVLLALAVLRPRMALFVGAAVVIAIEEFELTSTDAYFESGIAKSILATRIAGLSFMDAFTLILLLPVLLREWERWRQTGRWRTMPMDRYFLPVLAVYAFGATQGLFNALTFSHFTWEARDILTILAWYFIASRAMERPRDGVVLVAVLLGAFFLKSFLFLYRLVAGQGLFYGFDFYRPALGADVPFMAVPLITLLAASVLLRQVRARWKLVIALLAGYWSVWFVQSLGRASYITATAAMVVIAVVHRKQLRSAQVAVTAGAAALGGVVYYFIVLSAVNRELLGQVFQTTINWVDAVTLYQDLSIGQRLLEIMNISETLTRAGAWLWGLGWGAPWSEIAVKMPVDVAAFEYMESVRGVHTSAHLDALYFLLKVGILGTVVLYAGWLRFAAAGIRMLAREQDRWERLALTAVVAMLIIFIPNYVYFIKLKVLLGLAFAVLSFHRARQMEAGA